MGMIEIENLSLGFGTKRLFNAFNCLIHSGEFVGIFGQNGVGKSTFFRAILGLIKPISGNIRIDGNLVKKGNLDIGYMPQSKSGPHNHQLTGRAYLAATLNGLSPGLSFSTKQKKQQVDEIIDLIGMQNYIDSPYAKFSGGEKQRLSLAQALLNHPKILILDEPLSCVDPGQQLQIIHAIGSIQRQLKVTILLTAHDINPLLNVITKVIYVSEGRAAVGTVAEVLNSDTLSWLYNTPIEVISYGENKLILHKQLDKNINHVHPTFF